MNDNNINLSSLQTGMMVEINPKSDRSRKVLTKGIIAEILTKASSHPHGILVLLETGEIGRVKQNYGASRMGGNKVTSTLDSNITENPVSLKTYIEQGENHHIEFKSGALWSSKLNNHDIKTYKPASKELHAYGKAASKIIISKTVASLLNSDGGTLIIGVKENKNENTDEIIGVETEFHYLKDPCQDGYRRMLIDIVKDYFPANIFNHINQYIQIKFEEVSGNLVCGITAIKSNQRVFLKLNKVDHFFIRTDASTRELVGEEVLDYCERRFSSK